MIKIRRISLKLNFSPNALGCYGLTQNSSKLGRSSSVPLEEI